MMKRAIFFLSLLTSVLNLKAQDMPIEWRFFSQGDYMYNIQSDYKPANSQITDFKSYLTDIARAELAKQIELKVSEKASLEKASVNGSSSISYSSTALFSTDVQLSLVKTDSRFDEASGMTWAVAYVNRGEVIEYESSALTVAISAARSGIATAENYYSQGFKSKADGELNQALALLESADNSLAVINAMGAPAALMNDLGTQVNGLRMKIKASLSEHSHATKVHFKCAADCFGKAHPGFVRMIKAELSKSGCSFVETLSEADWSVVIDAYVEEYNKSNVGGSEFYYSDAYALVTVNKNMTGQCIYEDNTHCRGGAVTGYTHAAQKALENLAKNIGTTIKQKINL